MRQEEEEQLQVKLSKVESILLLSYCCYSRRLVSGWRLLAKCAKRRNRRRRGWRRRWSLAESSKIGTQRSQLECFLFVHSQDTSGQEEVSREITVTGSYKSVRMKWRERERSSSTGTTWWNCLPSTGDSFVEMSVKDECEVGKLNECQREKTRKNC